MVGSERHVSQVCAEPGCPKLQPCPTHPKPKAWANSTRRATLPANWPALKRACHQRDNWTCVDCGLHDPTGRLLEADHDGDRDDHRIDNLRTRCTLARKGGNGCHDKHTKRQAAEARRQAAARRSGAAR